MFKSILPLSFIIGARFFGLFIILPVISVYAAQLKGSTPLLIGFLMGVYALTQILFQLPFGMLSDKIGRKKTLVFGLILFIIGSYICANSSDIYTMIFGRFLQGAGAIGAVAAAMIADFTSEDKRSVAMAIMGGFIALSFAASMVLSPLLSHKYGLSSLFYISIIVSVFCLFLLVFLPSVPKIKHANSKTKLSDILKDKNLALLSFSNFTQKLLLGAAFLSIPIILTQFLGYPKEKLWVIYSISTVFGFLATGLGGFLGERKNLAKSLLLVGIVLFILAYLFFIFADRAFVFGIGVVIFFMGFNLHEPIMQSMASKFAKSNEKGKALGVFNSFGNIGSFCGSMVAGYALAHDFALLSEGLIALAFIWFCLIFFLKNPSDFKSIKTEKELDLANIAQIKGVYECYKSQNFTTIKYDSTIINEASLKAKL